MPVAKKVDDVVIGATINQQGALRIRATRVGGESALAQIIRMVGEAQMSKAPIERFADTVSRVFVPVVVGVAALTFVVWMALGAGGALPPDWLAGSNAFLFAFLKAIAVLVIAW